MNRAQRRAAGIPKSISSSIEEAEKRRTANQYSVAVASAMWDSGYDAEEIKRLLTKIWYRFDSFNRSYASVEDYRLALRQEAGIDFTYC